MADLTVNPGLGAPSPFQLIHNILLSSSTNWGTGEEDNHWTEEGWGCVKILGMEENILVFPNRIRFVGNDNDILDHQSGN